MADRITAQEMFQNVQAAAEGELARSSLGLAFSGFAAGLNISFGFVAAAALFHIGDTPESTHLWGAVGYPLGFILVITARAQLFTENTLTPVILVVAQPTRRNILNTVRLWTVVLLANLGGAFLFSYGLSVLSLPGVLDRPVLEAIASSAYTGEWVNLLVRAVLGGWLIALIVWVLQAGAGLAGQILLIWIITFVIQAARLSHSIAGASEVLYLAHTEAISYLDWLVHFQAPVTLGNIIGGVVFVALVNYGQAVGAGQDVDKAARMQEERRIRRESERGERK